jgi:hypothetical protein
MNYQLHIAKDHAFSCWTSILHENLKHFTISLKQFEDNLLKRNGGVWFNTNLVCITSQLQVHRERERERERYHLCVILQYDNL